MVVAAPKGHAIRPHTALEAQSLKLRLGEKPLEEAHNPSIAPITLTNVDEYPASFRGFQIHHSLKL
jgi:hypothetical protein